MARTPTVEFQITSTGATQFAGAGEADRTPDLVEAMATDGTADIYFLNEATIPDTKYPDGDIPWWAAGVGTGQTVFHLVGGLPRPFDLRGTRANKIHVTLGTATRVVVTCSRES